MMNKRGSIFFGITLGIFLWFMGVLFLPFLLDDVSSFRDSMDCSNTSITGGNMFSCLIGDAAIPYLIWFLVSLSLGFIFGSKA